ncbi:MAG: hypothetical protein QXF56_05370 [Candidatus Micrarchaeia archaeon]
MRKAQLFSQDIIFAIILALFLLSMWFVLRDRVLHSISTSNDRTLIDEAASNALSQLLETSGNPSNWNKLGIINDNTVWSIGLVSERNVIDSEKLEKFVDLSNGDNYTTIKRFIGLERESYEFNFTVYSLDGSVLYNTTRSPSASYGNASYSTMNTTALVERYALLNNSLVKLRLGVWIE